MTASIKSQSINAMRKAEMDPVSAELRPLMDWGLAFMDRNGLEAVDVGDGLFLRRYVGRDKLASLNPEIVGDSMRGCVPDEDSVQAIVKTMRNRREAERRKELREYCEAEERGDEAEPPATSTIAQVESYKRRRQSAKAKHARASEPS